MRRVLSGLALLALAAPVTPVSAQQFVDVAGTRYEDAFRALAARGVVSGYPDGTGRPAAILNRAEGLKVILAMQPRLRERVRWYEEHRSRLPLFRDVQQGAWYAPTIEAAFEAGIVTGYRDRTFRPGQPLTTEEAIVLLMRVFGEHAQRPVDGEEAWFRADLDRAIEKNLLAAEEPLFLGEAIARGAFFDVVYRMDAVRSRKLSAFADGSGTVRRHAPLMRRPIAELPRTLAPGGDFSISIPTLGISNLPVIHPADSTTSKGLLAPLRYGVGHLFAYPGGGGKVMIYGHSSSYAWDVSKYTKIFRRVNELKPGDHVQVAYKGKQYLYEVTYQEDRKPSDTSYVRGPGEELILYTCWPPNQITYRRIVHTKPVTEVAVR